MRLFSKKLKSKPIYKIVALGNTGVGKSSLLNMLGNTNEFQVGEDSTSQTRQVDSKVKFFLGDPKEIKLCLIDTQGLFDTSGDQQDMENIRNMVTSIRRHKSIHLFFYCVDEMNPRFTTYIQDTITLFDSIFPNFMDHMVLVFNKSRLTNIKNREMLINQWKDKFSRVFGLPINKEIPFVFLDSNVSSNEQKSHDDQAEILKNIIISKKKACDVIHIEPKCTVRVKLREELVRLKDDIERHRKLIENIEKEIMASRRKTNKYRKKLLIICGSTGGTVVGFIIVLIVFF
jgi:GTPase SAR1 family protein